MLKDEYRVYEEKNEKEHRLRRRRLRRRALGRANAAVLDRISVDYYGTPTPIQQIASIGSPDPRQLLIQPWDAGAVKLIEKAILNSDLGINPQNDGKAIRLTFPQLTEERRKELVKQIRKYAEGGKVAIRNIRRDAMETFKKKQKASELTEDDLKIAEKGPAEAHRRYVQGAGRPAREEGKGTDGGLMGLFTKKDSSRGRLTKTACLVMLPSLWTATDAGRRSAGFRARRAHKAGAESFRRLGTFKELGIDYLTVYAFSTENWKRPPEEIDGIMQLLRRYLHECIDTMERDGNRLRFLGDLSVLDDDLKELIRETNEISARIEGFQANVCLNYGGRDEIIHAARAFARLRGGGEAERRADGGDVAQYLYSNGLPDPELLIRPGGEKRISNYLLAVRVQRVLLLRYALARL